MAERSNPPVPASPADPGPLPGVPAASTRNARIPLREKLGYACGDVASVLYYRTFAMFLMIFYTDVYGISAAAVSLMFLVTRFWDAANDPIMGMIADRTRSRHGKFRPWLRWMLIPWIVIGVALFTVPPFGPHGKLIYAWITYTLAGMVYTSINIPYGALMGVMSHHSSDRTLLATFRFYGAYTGDFIVKGSLIWLVATLGAGNDAAGYQRTVILYAIASSCLFLVTFSATKERVPVPTDQRMDLRRDLAELLRNGPWLAVSCMGIGTLLWISVRDGTTLYFFKYFVGDYDVWATWFLVLTTAATFAGVACTKLVTDRLGSKRTAFIVLNVAIAIITLGYYFVGPDDVGLIFAIGITAAFLNGPLMPMFWSMIADTADYGEWKFGRRITGLTFSAGTFSHKAGWAIGGAITGWMLATSGYVANAQQTVEALGGIRLLMGVVTAVLALLTAGVAFFYKIDSKMERQMEEELSAKNGGA